MKKTFGRISGDTRKHLGPVYARFFSASVLRELAHTGHSVIAGRIARQYLLFKKFGPSLAVRDFYDAIFKRLVCDYRHEYIYKNAIAEKIILGKHNLNTAFMLTEFRADNCKADAVVLNGTSHVYEIKSEMDSFDRLDRQLAAYRKLFDGITVITTERLYKAVDDRIPREVGIMVLAEGGYRFKTKSLRREAISNRANVDPVVIFNSLQRNEYLKIIERKFGETPRYHPNTQIYSEAKKFFEKLTPEIAHDAMVETLKLRRQTMRVADLVPHVPSSLKAASLSLRLTKQDRERFVSLLDKNITSAFA